ncbi:MAG: FAD:protein FMN transferase ApbE [Methylococcaceae bacterium]|nr:FAD:protein FMN transferase ApbE [Methylococcaceae bacterium]
MLKPFNKKVAGLCLLLIFLLSACDNQAPQAKYPFVYSDGIMGTSFTIKASHLPETVKHELLKTQIKSLLDGLNAELSTYESQSALSLFNQNQSVDWESVPSALLTVLTESQRISQLSAGAFDITVGKLVNLWGFGVDPMNFTAPEETILNEALVNTGYQHLVIDAETSKIKKDLPELYLDLSAIAKGYAVDKVALFLEEQGINDYMVEIGGEVRLKGKNINQGAWRIAIEKPTPEKRMIQKVVPLSNISMATSGDYRNFFESKGIRYSHTIDPRTGRPITHKLASVTILSDTAMTADALATAMMVLGEEQGYQLAEKQQIAALFIIKTADGFEEKSTAAFIEFFKEKP